MKPLHAISVLVVLSALWLAAAAWSMGSADPTRADLPAITKKLAQIGVRIRPTDHLYETPASSMLPTLRCARPALSCQSTTADFVLARPYGSAAPKRGELVAFHTPPKAAVECGVGGVYLKRIVALPGETWAENDGTIYIDGAPLREPYVKPIYSDHFDYPPRKIPAGQYFVMGDNRAGSCDSRRWGTVPRRNIVGKLIAIWWPLSRVRRL